MVSLSLASLTAGLAVVERPDVDVLLELEASDVTVGLEDEEVPEVTAEVVEVVGSDVGSNVGATDGFDVGSDVDVVAGRTNMQEPAWQTPSGHVVPSGLFSCSQTALRMPPVN